MSCHFWCDASQYEVYVMQIFILYFKFKHLGGKEGKKKKQQQLLLLLPEQINGEKDNESKLLLPNICHAPNPSIKIGT